MEKSSTCALCGALEVRTALEAYTEDGTEYLLYECTHCRGQFWMPFKNPGASWYEHDNRYADRNNDPILTANKKQTWVLGVLGDRAGRILDVGCGVGNFLAHAKKTGLHDLWGIDFDNDAVAAGKKTFGLEHLEVADLHEFVQKHPELHFNLITFFDVFEHIDNHNAFINDIQERLLPNGSIALSVPYRHGWRWLLQHDLPPRHLTRWDEESLSNFFERHGFVVRHTYRLPASLNYLVMKIRFRYGKHLSFGVVRKAKAQEQQKSGIRRTDSIQAQTLKIRTLHALAKTKDYLCFGLPAAILWLLLCCTRKRYTDIVVIAEKST